MIGLTEVKELVRVWLAAREEEARLGEEFKAVGARLDAAKDALRAARTALYDVIGPPDVRGMEAKPPRGAIIYDGVVVFAERGEIRVIPAIDGRVEAAEPDALAALECLESKGGDP